MNDRSIWGRRIGQIFKNLDVASIAGVQVRCARRDLSPNYLHLKSEGRLIESHGPRPITGLYGYMMYTAVAEYGIYIIHIEYLISMTFANRGRGLSETSTSWK